MSTQAMPPPREDRRFRPVIIAPTYNNAATLPDVLRKLLELPWPIIVVNDGSTDATPKLLAECQDAHDAARLTVLTHDRNRGKATALFTGFDAARAAGFTHAATMDTDGQLEPGEIPDLIAAARACPDALVLGRRDYNVSGLPRSRLVGWYTTSLGVWLETGVLVRDTQCGLRVYPLRLFDVVRPGAARYGMESEIIARASWAGCPIVDVPVTCHYFPEDEGVSHFRPWRDGMRQFLMHAKLTLRRLNPWPTPKLTPWKDAQPAPHDCPSGRQGAVSAREKVRAELGRWGLMSLWGQLRASRLRQLIVAGGFGIGTFMASLPLGWLHTPVGLYAAVRLRVHRLPVIVGTLLALPPVGPELSRAAITIGHGLLRWRLPSWEGLDPATTDFATLFWRFPLEWSLGGVIVGFLGNWIVIATLMLVFRLIPVREGGSHEAEANTTP